MTQAAAWWREADAGERRRARWLMIFRRQVKVRESSAKRLTIPGLTIALPHTLELAEVEPLPPPICLPLAPQVETAENLMERASTASNRARGTVAFAAMALHDVYGHRKQYQLKEFWP